MILEHALLHVRSGQETAFEAAMRAAFPLIAASPGFAGIEVRPDTQTPGRYLLPVRWQSISHHRDGFRASDRYQKWREALHRFYQPIPTISYFGEPL